MNKYKHHIPAREGWTLPSCLQSILDLRRHYALDQREIFLELMNFGHLSFHKNLREFLKRQNLECRFFNPFDSGVSVPIFLESELCFRQDVLAHSYYGKDQNPNFSIVINYDVINQEDKVVLHDPSLKGHRIIRLQDLVSGMEDGGDLGFYVIS